MISTLLSKIASSVVFKVIKSIFGRILAGATAALIFCLIIIFAPIKSVSEPTPNYELTYIFVDDNNNEYNNFEETHWSATDWSFLFDENDENDENNEEGIINNEEWEEESNEEGIINDEEWQVDPNEEWIINNEEWQENSNEELNNEEWTIDNGNVWLEDIDYVWEVEKTYSKCTTPWWVVVEHWDYILAYQQRDDVPDICNVQKRRCNNWVLDWSFTQWYCRDDVKYDYTREKVVAHNNTSKSELIQNPKYAKNDWANFDTKWKINGKWNTPTTIRDDSDKSQALVGSTNYDQNVTMYKNCKTPRWDIVSHGQFTKAYASPLGFTDDVCKSELRLCLDWELQWNYSYKKCQYTNIPYSEFIDGDKTIFDLYAEAYNLWNWWLWYLADVENLYNDAYELYWEDMWSITLEEIINELEDTHHAESSDNNSYKKKSFFQHTWERLVSLF